MNPPSQGRAEEARRRAQEHFSKAQERESAFVREREKAEAAQAAKTARLRALRLAKEEEDRRNAALKPPQPRRKRPAPGAAKGKAKPG